MKDTEKRNERVVQHQEDLPPEPSTAERLDEEREVEQVEGITPERRGSPAAPSDMTERELPHPSDVNEIGQRS